MKKDREQLEETTPENTEKSNGNFFRTLGELTVFSSRFFVLIWTPPYELEELFTQIFRLGYKSLFLVTTTAFIIGFVMSLQLYPSMKAFGAEDLIPNMVAIAVIREIGPVLTGLICAGKTGSGIGAEIGSMKVTDQIDAMSISGVDPYKYLVVTRVLAMTLTMPFLVIYSAALSLVGSYVAVNVTDNMTLTMYINTAFEYMYFYDFVPSIIKSFFFGFTIAMVSCFYGYRADHGTLGVGKAANASVVISSLIIFFLDMLAAQLSHYYQNNFV
mgnify:CR=1 FL=1|jgi:phospholipid/cholesterol/gamma-HCH transport system permease protein